MHTYELVEGVRNFHGKRLNIIQIGLGTFGTFAQNLARPNEAYHPLTWIMEAASDNSPSMLAVGVEPVPEHVNALRPTLKSLPNASIVQGCCWGSRCTCNGTHHHTRDILEMFGKDSARKNR